MFTSSSPLSQNYSSVKDLRVSRFSSLDTSADSPYQTRVKSIEKRLGRVKDTIEAKHVAAKNEEIENKIKQIDQNITENDQTTEASLKKFTENINELQENLAAEIVAREILEERSLKEMQTIESSIATELKKENQQSKEAERVILGKTDAKVFAAKAEFVQEQERLEQVKRENYETISEQVEGLQRAVKEERAIREEFQNALINSMVGRVNKVKEGMQVERKFRQETENFLYSKFEEISRTLERQVNAEREKRENSEGQMLKLLEEACDRLENHIGFH